MAIIPDNTDLVDACLRVRARCPNEYELLVRALSQVSAQMAGVMVGSASDVILRAQGCALMANEIATTFLKAPTLMENKRNKVNGQSSRQSV